VPIPESFFAPQERLESSADSYVQTPFPPDDPLAVGPEHLDNELRVPLNAQVRKKTFIRTFYTPPAELVLIEAESGCELYKIHFSCREISREYLLIGTQELLVRTREVAYYQLTRLVRRCPGGGDRVPWTEDLLLSAEQPSGDTTAAEDLLRRMGEVTEGPPSIGAGDPDPDGPRPAVPYWEVPEVLLRLISAQGYNTPVPEGDFTVLRETVWVRVGPLVARACWAFATYRAGVRTTRWRIGTTELVSEDRQPVLIEPPLTFTRAWRIPGCR
jgi:hypothetical protein